MHNKSITFDNAVTIVGGRNIGAEYFGASDVFNYHDLDVLGIGLVADHVSTEFDTYWNASETVPVTAFVEPDDPSTAPRRTRASGQSPRDGLNWWSAGEPVTGKLHEER